MKVVGIPLALAAMALQDAWEKSTTLPPIVFTEEEAYALAEAIFAATPDHRFPEEPSA